LILADGLALWVQPFERTGMTSSGAEHRWIADVDLKLRREWRISAADAGLSKEDLKRHWTAGISAADFVAWFAEKYDLIRFEREPSARPSRLSL